MKKIISITLIFSLVFSPAIYAETKNLLGADAILLTIDGKSDNELTDLSNELTPEAILEKINALRQRGQQAFTADESKLWLSLNNQLLSANQTKQNEFSNELDELILAPLSTASMIASLPNKNSWNQLFELSLKSDNNDIHSLLTVLYTSVFVDNKAVRNKTLGSIKEKVKELDNDEQKIWRAGLQDFDYQIALNENNVDGILDNLTSQLNNENSYAGYVEIPDIISLAGEDEATAWVQKTLPTSILSFSASAGSKTNNLIDKTILDNIDSLTAPHWSMVNDLDSIQLYEELDKKFPNNKVNDIDFNDERNTAKSYYLIAKLLKASPAELNEYISLFENENIQLSKQTIKALKDAGHAHTIQNFLYQSVSKNHYSTYWYDYIELSSFVGKSAQANELLKEILKDDDLNDKQRNTLNTYYIKSLYADNQIEKAAKLVISDFELFATDEKLDQALTLAKIGILKNNANWIDFGLTQSKALTERKITEANYYLPIYQINEYVEVLRSSGKDTSAELFISEQLKTLLKNAKKSSELYGSSVLAYALSEGNPLLVELIGIYHDNQQWNDILTIVNNYKYWNAGNLNTIYTLKDSTKTYLGYYVATALHHNNQTDIAKDILRSLIWNDGGYDKAYQLYTDIESSENATKFLQQIYAKDQFEERPLIWQAHIKLKENDLDEAKALIKTAISIDPSDGEQGVNDRMRAYAILSEILKQQNMLDEAKLYANVVESIRTSEKADKHTNLGLLKAGIAMYEEASEQFADAYCVQSRLAIQLTKSGQYDQAQQHYRKAYELMPDSFGRVESHCFGCENIFSDARAQSIADSVFSEMVIETPDKPQVHYMLGYLREEQGDYVSALKSYRKAVALDPQYLNAWKKIFNLNKKTHIESWEINNSALKLIALDPGFEHISLDIGVISDLKGLWQTYYDAQSLLEKKPDFTYTLDASSQHLEFSETENNAISDFYRSYNSSSGDKTKYIENPSVSLLETNIIKSLLYINREEQNEGW